MSDNFVEDTRPKDERPRGFKFWLFLVCFVSLFGFALYKTLHKKPPINPDDPARVASLSGSENGNHPAMVAPASSSPSPEKLAYLEEPRHAGIIEDSSRTKDSGSDATPLAGSTPIASEELVRKLEEYKAAMARDAAPRSSSKDDGELAAKREAVLDTLGEEKTNIKAKKQTRTRRSRRHRCRQLIRSRKVGESKMNREE